MRSLSIPVLFLTGVAALPFAVVSAPRVLTDPVSQAANPGSNIAFSLTATGIAPLRFQWLVNGAPLAGRTNLTLTLTNLQPADAGEYSAVVSDSGGAVTSRVARLEVVSGFTRVTNSTLARATNALGAAWGDFNNDGWVDLVVSGDFYLVYTNAGQGSFVQITNRILGGDFNAARTGTAWADYDNDGFLDLAIGGWGGGALGLYRNRGDGQFTRIMTNIFNGPGVQQMSAAWGDYDNDGFVDLYVPTASAGSGPYYDLLFRNNGDGSFAKITNSPVVTDATANQGALWADFDNDGDLDLFVTSVSNGKNRLYRNDGAGTFVTMTNSIVMQDGGGSGGCAWGDFDNDGDLDLFVTNFSGNALYYVNDGSGGFSKVSSIIAEGGPSAGCMPIDFDNDGWLDLVTPGSANLLYHNSGNGSFTRVTTGPIVTQPVRTFGNNSFAAADIDRDGFQDLLWVDFNGNSQLFHNDGNSNRWLTVRCEGRMSNRAGIGAKVRATAWMNGRVVTQMREIGGGGLVFTQSEPVAAFGLGDATNAALRVEWPSGLVQSLTNVMARQFLHLIEPVVRIVPAATNVPAGSAVDFRVTSECRDCDVQWYHEGRALAGQTNLALGISNVRIEDLGRYTIHVHDRHAKTTSESAAATLSGKVTTTESTRTHYVRSGSNATLTVVAGGAPPLAYQWFREAVPIERSTNATLLLTNVQVPDEGLYSVVISNSYGEVRSRQGSIVVLVRPSILVQPLGQNTVSNGTVSFSVGVTGHPMPMSFRWRRGGLTFTNIIATSSNCFVTLRNIRPDSTNPIAFTVVVTNLAGLVLSSNAVVTFESDADGDGMSDRWEEAYGLNSGDSEDAAVDSDRDGVSNRDEHASGTDPQDARAVLRFEEIRVGEGMWTARFNTQSNRTYTVQGAENPNDRWTNLIHVLALSTNGAMDVRGPAASGKRFMRIITPGAP